MFFVNIYIYRERERERESSARLPLKQEENVEASFADKFSSTSFKH